MRELTLALVCISSWLGGGAATLWASWSAVRGRQVADLRLLSLLILLLLIVSVAFHVRTVSLLMAPDTSPWRRLSNATAWAVALALGSAVLLSALLGGGRLTHVMSPIGRLILVWCAVMTLLFAILGAAAHRAGVWIEPRD